MQEELTSQRSRCSTTAELEVRVGLQVGILVGVGSRFFNPRVISVIWFGADLLCICIQGGETSNTHA